MKKIITLLLFLFVLFISFSKVTAQGTCTCTANTPINMNFFCEVKKEDNECDIGYFTTCSAMSLDLTCENCDCLLRQNSGKIDCGQEGIVCCNTGEPCGTGLKCKKIPGLGGSNIGSTCELIELDTTPVKICNSVNDKDYQKCIDCMGEEEETKKIWTGIGCINTSPTELIKQILQIAVGLGGGIAFLLLIYGAFLMTTSAGDPKAADNAKQIITSAITGLLVIIFSVVILNIIGVQILQIPGL